MAKTQDYDLGEFTFPRGWFMIADASTVGSDKPESIRFFGKDFVLYRGQDSGELVMLDAYCPHMGTHLGRNSTSYVAQAGPIEGDSIRCPYHAWRFGPDGKCNDIPYAKGPIPPLARIKSYPVVESMGAVFFWHDPEGGEPEWDVPFLNEWNDPSWVRWTFDDLGSINTHPQEIIDNITDVAHFGPVHGLQVEFFENEFRGHLAAQRQGGRHPTLVTEDGPILVTEAIYNGPGILITKMFGTYDSYIFIAHTPVDDGVAYVWHALLVESPSGAKVATAEDTEAARQYQAFALQAFAQDFEVWKHKQPCLKGLFIQGDGPFLKQRIWYKQFYNPRAMKQQFLQQVEGVHTPKGMSAAPVPLAPSKAAA